MTSTDPTPRRRPRPRHSPGLRRAARTFRSPSRLMRMLAVLALALAGLGVTAPAAHATGVPHGITLIRCQFSDNTRHDVPGWQLNTDEEILSFVTGAAGIRGYLDQATRGLTTWPNIVYGSWVTMPTRYEDDHLKTRSQLIADCIDASPNKGWLRQAPDDLVIVFRNQCGDSGVADGIILLDPCVGTVLLAARYVTQVLGLGPATSNDPSGTVGDEWDIMSTANVLSGPAPRWLLRPVGFNAPHLAALGAIPAGRILTWPAAGRGLVSLSALYGSDTTPTLPLMVKIPLDRGDPYSGHYLSVEYRAPMGLDAPVGAPSVQVREVNGTSTSLFRSGDDHRPSQHVVVGHIAVDVVGNTGPTGLVTIDGAFGQVPVPNVVGADAADALTTLRAAGFTVARTNRVDATCQHIGEVVAQNPGGWAAPGSRITITVGSAPGRGCSLA